MYVMKNLDMMERCLFWISSTVLLWYKELTKDHYICNYHRFGPLANTISRTTKRNDPVRGLSDR